MRLEPMLQEWVFREDLKVDFIQIYLLKSDSTKSHVCNVIIMVQSSFIFISTLNFRLKRTS